MKQIYYRGSLKFCNYSCSYCPFSKTGRSERQLAGDKRQWELFIEAMRNQSFSGAIQVVPYGEALIHEYYWEGLAELSGIKSVQAVGAQSNFSFPVKRMLHIYQTCGGNTHKLRLWGTFHPEMTSVEEFLRQCQVLLEEGISFCVGAVGVPEHVDVLRQLREGLDESVYMWINRMDGLGRNYSEAEKQAFIQMDEYFELELRHFPPDSAACQGAVFVEGDGSMRQCNLCHEKIGNLYTDGLPTQGLKEVFRERCRRRSCDCFLSYGSRTDIPELFFFQPFPAFRIPSYKKAVFFDVDGTIVADGNRRISEKAAEKIRRLAVHSRIFLATSLPYEMAMRKVEPIAACIEGGVFAGGAELRVGTWKKIMPLDQSWLSVIRRKAAEYHYRFRSYHRGKILYKITLTASEPDNEIQKKMSGWNPEIPIRIICEDGRIQLTAAGTGKFQGVQEICRREGINITEIAVFGNGESDVEMIEKVPCSLHLTQLQPSWYT